MAAANHKQTRLAAGNNKNAHITHNRDLVSVSAPALADRLSSRNATAKNLPRITGNLHQNINRTGIGGGRLPGPQLSRSTLTSQEYGSESTGHLPGLADRTPSRKSLNPSSNSARAFSGPCDGSLQNTITTCRQKHHFLAVHQGMAWKYVVTSVLRPLQWHLVSATSNVAFAMLRSKP